MKVFMMEQGSESWFLARRGVPTASEFDKILTPKKRQLSAQADEYIDELCADQLSPLYPAGIEYYTSRSMEWGQQCEAEARNWYRIERDCEVQQVGFCLSDDGRFGCSPDGLVGEDGGLELKCPLPKTHATYLRKGVMPPEYLHQVHGSLIVTGRKWWDFMSYSVGMSPLLIRIEPNDYTEDLKAALEQFWPRYVEALKRLKGEREPGIEPEEAA